MNCSVIKNSFGFFELKKKPTTETLKKYYSEKYYQEAKGSYKHIYSEEELMYVTNKIEQRYAIISKYLNNGLNDRNFLDIGCGEGWALKYFSEKSWNVTGLDYSDYGCRAHNPEMTPKLLIGDVNDSIIKLVKKKLTFNVIWLDNILEHVLNPLELLIKIKKLINNDGILVIEVPNDFSITQMQLLKKGYISDAFWIANPDHISYFNMEGLVNICNKAGWSCLYIMSDFPIDFFLFNEDTNYINDKSKGSNCHKTRVIIENMLHNISPIKTNELYRVLAEMGLGRSITGFFRLKEEK
ncbi:MAG: class I SAM-dependent methyltransferase [Peptococcaceae bacterium]|nr:class I SAM-dependent methyltransferase [Peptococcaceae bacterium]